MGEEGMLHHAVEIIAGTMDSEGTQVSYRNESKRKGLAPGDGHFLGSQRRAPPAWWLMSPPSSSEYQLHLCHFAPAITTLVKCFLIESHQGPFSTVQRLVRRSIQFGYFILMAVWLLNRHSRTSRARVYSLRYCIRLCRVRLLNYLSMNDNRSMIYRPAVTTIASTRFRFNRNMVKMATLYCLLWIITNFSGPITVSHRVIYLRDYWMSVISFYDSVQFELME